jgi:rare lipoprotein A
MGGASGGARRALGTLLVAALASSGCSLVRSPWQPAPPPLRGGVQHGIASWYGPGFHGRPTASGERYDQDALTAAHPSLPFGTRVRVTNLDNGRAVDVRITDRGPFVGGRVVDLSRGAARAVGLLAAGIGPVRLEVLAAAAGAAPAAAEPAPAAAAAAAAAYHVEVGAFRDPALAEHLRRVLAGRFPDAHVAPADDDRHRVRLGPYRAADEARAHAERVTRLGYRATLVEGTP